MAKEFRILLLSEKSGKKYSVTLRLIPMLLLSGSLCCVIVLAFISGIGFINIFQMNMKLQNHIQQLEGDMQKLKQENHEAILYKQWADSIIFRRFNYEDVSGKGTTAPAKKNNELDLKNTIESDKTKVDIDEFDVRRLNLELDFEVSFKLINRSQSGNKLSGYLYIIALNTEVKPEICASWPPTDLLSGIPKDYKKGSTFAINYLKHVKGRINQPNIGAKFNRIDIMAYSEDGNIILKRGFYIERLLQQSPYE